MIASHGQNFSFRSTSAGNRAQKFYPRKIFIVPKVSSRNFRGGPLNQFCAIMLISAVIGEIEPFVTRVTKMDATVKVNGPAKVGGLEPNRTFI